MNKIHLEGHVIYDVLHTLCGKKTYPNFSSYGAQIVSEAIFRNSARKCNGCLKKREQIHVPGKSLREMLDDCHPKVKERKIISLEKELNDKTNEIHALNSEILSLKNKLNEKKELFEYAESILGLK